MNPILFALIGLVLLVLVVWFVLLRQVPKPNENAFYLPKSGTNVKVEHKIKADTVENGYTKINFFS